MRFLLDHDVPDDIAYVLDALGHEVRKLREVAPSTVADEEVWRLAGELSCVLLSCNRDDFLAGPENAAIRTRHPGAAPVASTRTGSAGGSPGPSGRERDPRERQLRLNSAASPA